MSQEVLYQGPSPAREIINRKIKKVTMGALAGAALVATPVYVHEKSQQQAAETLQANQDKAYANARLYLAELDRSGTDISAKLPIWQGVITHRTPNGEAIVAISPIILSDGQTDAETPTDNPKAPSYFGVISSVGKKVTIVPYEFTADNRFTQAAPDGQIKRSVDSYVSPVYHDDVREGFQAFAFESEGSEKVVTPYHHDLISPGFQPR